MATGDLLSFGPYLLDTEARRLTRDGAEVRIASRHVDLLCLLASRPGQVLSKDLLIESACRDVAVTTGSLDQAIHLLRRTLTLPGGSPCIETQARRGYRFVADVARVQRRESDAALDTVLETHRAWIEGRAALETLERGAIVRARKVFEDMLARAPGQAPAHVGLGNACALQFEMTRTDARPDTAALDAAHQHAREACRLDARYGEAWATLGFVLKRTGRRDDALAAARQAIVLEPDSWRHHLRLSAASWGEERLREGRRTLTLLPGLAMAHWLAASVLVARQALDEAERELVAGVADSHDGANPSPFSSVALHWLLGLIALAAGDTTRAFERFERELRLEHSGHLYAKESAANTWYAIGATRIRLGDIDGAVNTTQPHRAGRIILLHGASSSGKSTLSKAIQNELDEPFLHFASDYLALGLPARRERHGPFQWWDSVRPRFFNGFQGCIATLATAGNDLIVDHIIEFPEWRSELRLLLKSFDVFLVAVHCSLEELDRRERSRGDRQIGEGRSHVVDDGIHNFGAYDYAVDTTRRDPSQVALELIQRWRRRLVSVLFDENPAS